MRSLTFWENITLVAEYFFRSKKIFHFPFRSKKDIRRHQFAKIKFLITLAYEQTDFYYELYSKHNIHPRDIKKWKDFQKLPTITKEDIFNNTSRLIVRSKIKNDKLIVSKSSGSSGKIIDIVSDGKSWIKQTFIMLRMYKQAFFYKPFDIQALIYTSKYPYQSLFGFYRAFYLNTLTRPKKMMKQLVSMQPNIIVAYPSILLELIAQFPRTCQKLHPKAISTNSEHSTQDQRDYIASVFHCPVFDEYSTEELTLVGYQCKNKHYHLQEDASYIEILDVNSDRSLINGELGEIVGTCLVNDVMPIIRYRQGDLGAIKTSDCSCGNNCRILENIAGRKNASFRLKNGKIIPSGRILDWTYKLFLKFKIPINQFNVIQKSRDMIDVLIIPSPTYNSRIHKKKIIRSFKKEFGDFLLIRVITVKKIARTPAGKHIPIKSFVR